MRKRDNLIAFRTTEGSVMEQVHEKAKQDGASIKAIIESWAVSFKTNNATPEGERE